MKQLTLILFLIAIIFSASGQGKIQKNLYYSKLYLYSIGCGTITYASVMEFVTKPNEKNKSANRYYIVIECPELYGDNFFKEGAAYKLTISKDYKKIGSYFAESKVEDFRKKENFYLCEDIEIMK